MFECLGCNNEFHIGDTKDFDDATCLHCGAVNRTTCEEVYKGRGKDVEWVQVAYELKDKS